MRTHAITLILLLWVVAYLPLSHAETIAATSGSWGTSGAYHHLYQAGSEARIEGKVLRTEDITPLAGMEPGISLKLQGERGNIDVHLGPRWFVLERDLLFTKGEPVVVVGVTIRLGGKPTLIAREILRGKHKAILRELSGRPLWEKATSHEVPQ